MTDREEIIKQKLLQHKLNDAERKVINSALFNTVTYASVGAAALGVSGRMWARSREAVGKPRSAIPMILGTFAGLALGGLMGMSHGMKVVRRDLPSDSPLRAIIQEHEKLKQEEADLVLSDVQK
ncbi:hypothetical protein BC940DRAFT_297601 [Gongronella butleri]|nr:hypothetical protein BC940DRAFT_297601 [Gongronella butleri]